MGTHSSYDRSSFHKELGSQRIERDDVNNIIQRIDTKLVNSFDIGQDKEEKALLINIATGTVALSKVSESLRRKGTGRVCPSQANI